MTPCDPLPPFVAGAFLTAVVLLCTAQMLSWAYKRGYEFAIKEREIIDEQIKLKGKEIIV